MLANKVFATIFKERPVFEELLTGSGHLSISDYYASRQHRWLKVPTGRQNELLTTVSELLDPLLGKRVASSVTAQLKQRPIVSTAGHHDTVSHPFFSSAVLAEAEYARNQGFQNVIIFSCGGISLNNSSFPRGFLLHDSQMKEQRLYLTSLKHHRHPVFRQPRYTQEAMIRLSREINTLNLSLNQKNKLKSLLLQTYGSPTALRLPDYSSQLTRGIFTLWKKIPGLADINVVYLEQETLVNTLLRKFHLKDKTILNDILLTPKIRSSFLKQFDGISGGFDSKEQRGTELFWGVTKTGRVPLKIVGQELTSVDHTFRVRLTASELAKALNEKTLMPSMALTFSVLSFYYGMATAGGFCQVNYLTEMREAYKKFLLEIKAMPIDKLITKTVPTDFFSGEFIVALLSKNKTVVPATPIDLILYKNKATKNVIKKLLSTLTLAESITLMAPELYKITTGTYPKTLIQPTHSPCLLIKS